jgi:Flp pilus assembly protein CpaB
VSDSSAGCASCRQNVAIGVLSVFLTVTTTGWIVTATRDGGAVAPPPEVAAPQPEMVEVVVAAKDLPVGTMLTWEVLGKFVERKRVPKDALPPAFIVSEEELVGKRLSRPVLKHETFSPQALTKASTITLPEGMDLISIPVSSQTAGFVGPGSKVDVLGTVRQGNKIVAFPLLVDMLVLAVDTQLIYNRDGTPGPTMISLGVTQEQALLLTLAKQRGCTFEILLRHPDKPLDQNYDLETVRKYLLNLDVKPDEEQVPKGSEVKPFVPDTAPSPRAKGE